MTKNNKSKKGFTIVELLVVIVVIGILAAISVVSYNGISNNARANTAKTQAKNVQSAAESYLSLKGNYPFSKNDFINPGSTDGITVKIGDVFITTTPSIDAPDKVQYFPCKSTTGAPTSATQVNAAKIVYATATATNTINLGSPHASGCTTSAI